MNYFDKISELRKELAATILLKETEGKAEMDLPHPVIPGANVPPAIRQYGGRTSFFFNKFPCKCSECGGKISRNEQVIVYTHPTDKNLDEKAHARCAKQKHIDGMLASGTLSYYESWHKSLPSNAVSVPTPAPTPTPPPAVTMPDKVVVTPAPAVAIVPVPTVQITDLTIDELLALGNLNESHKPFLECLDKLKGGKDIAFQIGNDGILLAFNSSKGLAYLVAFDMCNWDLIKRISWHIYNTGGDGTLHAMGNPKGNSTSMHRYLMNCSKGDGRIISHRKNTLDNRLSNLVDGKMRFYHNAGLDWAKDL